MDSRPRRLLSRADGAAVELARRPLTVTAAVLALNLALAACFATAGLTLLGDQADFFRELAPATWLSFVQLLLIAVVARAVHLRTGAGLPLRRSFWALAAVVFAVFAFDEITQSAIFVADALEDGLGLAPAAGFHDLEAVLLTLGFIAAGLVLLPHVGELLRHRTALALFGLGVCVGAASQTFDSFAPQAEWSFVAEETLKLSAEALFLGGFLSALYDVTVRPEPASALTASQEAATSAAPVSQPASTSVG